VKVLLVEESLNNFCPYAFVACSEETIRSKFMDCCKESVPELTYVYDADCAAEVPPNSILTC
jgi:hypothetical protein